MLASGQGGPADLIMGICSQKYFGADDGDVVASIYAGSSYMYMQCICSIHGYLTCIW